MEFEISNDAKALQNETRNLVQKVLIPAEKEVEETGVVPPAVLQKMRESGLFGLTIPEQFGGLGLDCLTTATIVEELGWCHSVYRSMIMNNNGLGSQSIILSGTEEQRKHYLPKMASGEIISAFALTEPGA